MIEEDEIREVEETLRPGWIGTDPRVSKFERMFGDYIGSQYNIARHSCTVSLHHSMLVAGINPGDFPNAEYISERTISLPLSAKLSDKDVEDVIGAMTKILDRFSK